MDRFSNRVVMMLMVVIFLALILESDCFHGRPLTYRIGKTDRLPTITRLYEKAVQSSSSGKGFGKVSKPQRRQELKESIISKRRQLEQLQAGAKADPSVGAVPEMIADRMIRRIVIFFGIPVFGGLGIFAAAFFTYKKYDIVMEPGLIAYATQFPFVVGLLGITYAIISSSWDPEEGSLLGIQEFFTNIQRIKDGTKRNKEIASLQLELDKEEQEFRQYR
eukprot:gene6809-7339_t